MPLRKSSVGTIRAELSVSLRSFRASQFRKKNSRSFLIGPPSDTPYTLRFSFALGRPAWLAKKSFALVLVLRRYSYKEPWKALVPLLVSNVTWAPEVRPKSAPALVVIVRNS